MPPSSEDLDLPVEELRRRQRLRGGVRILAASLTIFGAVAVHFAPPLQDMYFPWYYIIAVIYIAPLIAGALTIAALYKIGTSLRRKT